MATTKTDIANIALSHLGATPITDIDSPTNQQGRLAARFFDTTSDEVQSDHPWKFNAFRKALTADATAPVFGWDYRFALPTGNDADTPHCLRVRASDLDDTKEPWDVEARWFVCNVSTASILYSGRVLTFESWDPLAITSLSYCLAAKVIYAITKSLNIKRDLMTQYGSELQRARTVNGLQGPPKVIRSTTLTTDVR